MSTVTAGLVPVPAVALAGAVCTGAVPPAEAACGRRVLMISCAFPPTGGPGVQRSAKFAKYLPRFGWEPVVWSADHLAQLPHDESLTADLPAELIHHTRPAWSYTAGHRRAMRALRNLGLARLLNERQWNGLDWRMLRWFHGLAAHMLPDDQLVWALRSAGPLLRLVRRERIDVLYSTYSPVSNHLLGLLLKLATGRPWVADFRDLWTDDYCYAGHSRARRWIERRLEQTILHNADAVAAVTPSQIRILSQHVPHQAEKFVAISNGVDSDDYERVDRYRARQELHGPPDRFVLSFTGWFLSDRVDEGLIEGFGRFARWLRGHEGDFEFRVVGAISDAMIRRLSDAGTNVVATGYVPHHDAVRHMISADALLLPTPSGRNAETLSPAKAFEYLAAGRPILLVGPGDGEVQRLIRECRGGVCVESTSEAVCAALTDLWRTWRSGSAEGARFGCTPEQLKPFTREHLTGRLADVLSDVQRNGTSHRRQPQMQAAHGFRGS